MERPLVAIIRAAGRRELGEGWLYLPEGELAADTLCLHLVDAVGMEELAAACGYPREGLHTDQLEGIVECAEQLTKDPTDAQLLRAFDYYLRFDAWLPALDAPDPPPREELMRLLDRQFYEKLGPERADVPCREPTCTRGAVTLSIHCRPHHFTSVMRRPSPFED